MATQPPPRHINIFNTIWRDWIYFFWEKSEKSGWQYLGSFDPTTPEEITGIPTTAVSVKVIVVGLSVDVTNTGINIDLGDSTSGIANGYATTGSTSVVNTDQAADQSSADSRLLTNGKFPLVTLNYANTVEFSGATVFNKMDDTSDNTWIGTGLTHSDQSSAPAPSVLHSAGVVDVPGVLNKVKLTATGGNAIDAGTAYVWYQ